MARKIPRTLSFNPKLLDALILQAKKEHRTLNNYVALLLETNPIIAKTMAELGTNSTTLQRSV